MTRLDPETEPQDMECSILAEFPALDKVIARKHNMIRNDNYCSYTVIVVAKKGIKLDINDFTNHIWPDDIKCYAADERRRV